MPTTTPETALPHADAPAATGAPEDSATTLSARLRAGTRAVHSVAEREGFVTRLMTGQLDQAAYADLAAQHLVIYRALEQASAHHASDPRGSSLVFAELTRTPSIKSDLAFLLGPEWADAIDVLPQTRDYAARIEQVGTSLPAYAAHAYTRYLGDLSGGQAIRRMVQTHYGVPDEGVAFYTFREIPKAKPFKDLYRERLDALELSEEEVAESVEEAVVAFRMNQAIFQALGARH